MAEVVHVVRNGACLKYLRLSKLVKGVEDPCGNARGIRSGNVNRGRRGNGMRFGDGGCL